MDPIYPIVPTAPNIPPVAPAPAMTPTERQIERQRQAAERDRRRRQNQRRDGYEEQDEYSSDDDAGEDDGVRRLARAKTVQRQAVRTRGRLLQVEILSLRTRLRRAQAGLNPTADQRWALDLEAISGAGRVLLIEGAVPGATNGTVRVRRSQRQKK